MAFGQASGPPASARQVKELLVLLQELGHTDFRDARGPMGFTQRQAGGRFTSDEAAALIDRLHESPPGQEPSELERALRGASPRQLAAELERRGWTVIEPGSPRG